VYLKVALQIDIVVAKESHNEVAGGDTLRALNESKLAHLLHHFVNILTIGADARILSMYNEIDVVLLDKFRGDDPRAARDNLVDIAAVHHHLRSFILIENRLSLILLSVLIARN
jgi:hypothetical protein